LRRFSESILSKKQPKRFGHDTNPKYFFHILKKQFIKPMLQEELNENQETAVENTDATEETAATPVVAATTEEVVEEEEEEVVLDTDAPVVIGAAHDDFDWTKSKRGQVNYTNDQRATMLSDYDSTLKGIAAGTVARGRISSIVGADVVLDFGHKSDGLVPVSDCRDLDLKVGEYVEVYIESTEDGKGNLVLSRQRHRHQWFGCQQN
jgi:small subunit ribosomal protein S1